MIQLDLFPTRGFGLLCWGHLLHDHHTGAPYLVKTRRAASRQARSLPSWYPRATVVPVELHPAAGDEPPTYVIGGEP